MGHQAAALGQQARQPLLDEGAKALGQDHLRQPGIAGLLQAEHQVAVDLLLAELRRLPVALLHAAGVEQGDALHAERGDMLQGAGKHPRPGQGKHQMDRQCRRRRLVQAGDIEQGLVIAQGQQFPAPYLSPFDAQRQQVAGARPMHLVQVGQASRITDPGQAAVLDIVGREQDQVHGPRRVGD